MDIWNWVHKLEDDLREAGQAPSAQLINRLTDHVCDLDIERADALLPEARALAKTLGNPWLEVFVGHWEMRNRIGSRLEGEQALPDVVALFEQAHREDTIECPQSVCVTQDLAACYANIDGPGWVEERIAVSEETLARIDPTWSCFQCLSCEKADALMDDGRVEQALDYLDAQSEVIFGKGGEVYDGIPEMKIKALLMLGRAAEALAIIERAESEVDGVEWANCSQPRQLYKAHALALLSRDEDAMQAMLPWAQLAPGYRLIWLRAVAVLVTRAPEKNSWDLGSRVQKTLEHFSQVGAHRMAIEAASLGIELALQRGASWVARRQLVLARDHQAKLRQDRGAAEQLDALAALIEQAPVQQALPVPVDELLPWLVAQGEADQSRDPEREVQWLLLALDQRPDDAELVGMTASALTACAAEDEAIALLWRHVQTHTTQEEPLAYRLMNLLLQRGDEVQLRRLIALYRDTVPVTALWGEVQLAQRLGDWPELERAAHALLDASPDSHAARNVLAGMLMKTGRYAEAADCYRHLTQVLEEPRSAHWDLMTAATAIGDWQTVRASAKTIGMELTAGEGVVEEEWGWVIVRIVDDGEAMEYYARRTGPVTARVVENAPATRRQHVGDWVVFDAELVYPAPEDEEERKCFMATYTVVHTLAAGGFGRSWLVDGAHPGDEAYRALRESLEARGWKTWVHSRDDYRVTDPDGGEEGLPGMYFTLAAPDSVSVQEQHRMLAEATATWPYPMCWLRLAEAAGEDVQRHQEIIERYGL